MFRFLIRLAGFIFLVAIIRYFFRWLFQLAGRGSESAIQDRTVVVETRRDPVCGMFVSTEISVKAMVEGKEQHFCSTVCRDKWMSDARLRIAG